MQWRQLSARELEITFNTGSVMLCLDRKPCAARIITAHAETVVCTNRDLPEQDQVSINLWLNCQPRQIKYITDAQLDHILNHEDHRVARK